MNTESAAEVLDNVRPDAIHVNLDLAKSKGKADNTRISSRLSRPEGSSRLSRADLQLPEKIFEGNHHSFVHASITARTQNSGPKAAKKYPPKAASNRLAGAGAQVYEETTNTYYLNG